MPLDEATQSYLDEFGALSAPKPSRLGPEAARAGIRARQQSDPPGPPMARVLDTLIEVPDARLVLRTFTPDDAATAERPVIVYYHGGGWVLGDLDGFDATARRIAAATGCAVVLVDYRLAPEHPYPAAVSDAWHALVHILRLDPGRPVVVAGDSAGGNLASAVALRARDAGIQVAAQLLIYPVVDADFERHSYRDPANQLILDGPTMRWFWDQYVPDTERRADPDASPLRAPDHSGLAPAIVLTAENDVLRDEGEEYADALEAAGVPVIRRRFEGQMHGFLGMSSLPGSEAAMMYIGDTIAALLGVGGDQVHEPIGVTSS